MPSYGLIVEGDSDSHVFQNLIRKVNSPDAAIYPLPCGGVAHLMEAFPVLLKRFEYIHAGGPVDGALVIRDSDNRPINEVLAQMTEKLRNRKYRFPKGVEICCVQRNLDTWLLADEAAINALIEPRGSQPAKRINGTLEEIVQPKERLRKVLSEAGLDYTPTVLGEIAAHIDIQQLAYRIRSFDSFRQSVLRIWGR